MSEEENQKREQKKTEENLTKIAITKEADRAITEIVGRISDGFDGGRATKQEVASQMLLRFVKMCTEADIHAIRVQFFDPVHVMETIVRRAKETGTVPNSMREFLYEQFMASASPQLSAKKSRKSLKENVIIDNVQKDGEAA